MSFFEGIEPISYEGPESTNPYAFRWYDADRLVGSRTMAEHLRFAVCYWHSFAWDGADIFGAGTLDRPWHATNNPTLDPMVAARMKMDAAFEFFSTLGVNYFSFHDIDIAPAGMTFAETCRNFDEMIDYAAENMSATGVKLLWGTTNSFSHRRFMSGASTNPDPDMFKYAAAQVAHCLQRTQDLGGENYVLWGGREGYSNLLNTNMAHEQDQMARLLHMAVDHKKRIGFKGTLLIEPKPKEPTKHQYDSDAAACINFLRAYDLGEHFKLNIETNHATLAGHTMMHELEYAGMQGGLGSIDANTGDLMLGWDTDQFPTDYYLCTQIMLVLLKYGLAPGGVNFDAKVRRESFEPLDLFYAHIGGMDAFAKGLKIAAAIRADQALDSVVADRYSSFDSGIGKQIEQGEVGFKELEAYITEKGEVEANRSGRQELLEQLMTV